MSFFIPLEDGSHLPVEEDQDVTEVLGITKYEPPIPVHMNGEVCNLHGYTPKYDIENWKKYPDVIKDGEEVVMTEKLHGTWCCFGYHPDVPHPIVCSKGLSAQGLAFLINEENEKNLYIRALNSTAYISSVKSFEGDGIGGNVIDRVHSLFMSKTPFYIFGEVFGKGVQDLQYGATTPQFRVFDIYSGELGKGRFLPYEDLVVVCQQLEVDMVPVLYKGPFSRETMEEHTNGRETVSGTEACIREGIVITPTTERRDLELGRVKLKSVSEKYLLRKGGTELA